MPKVLKLVLCVIVQALLSSCAKEENPVEPTPPTSEKYEAKGMARAV
ncbi:hypothetical protein [Paenibacillus alvei]|nr:hypothetical protein [Paenibacillus alvei]